MKEAFGFALRKVLFREVRVDKVYSHYSFMHYDQLMRISFVPHKNFVL